MDKTNVIYADFPVHRDADICAMYNRMFSPFQAHTAGDPVGLFQGHSDINKELDRICKRYGKTPQPEGV